MNEQIGFVVYGVPIPHGSTKTPTLVAWRNHVAQAAKCCLEVREGGNVLSLLDGALSCSLKFTFPRNQVHSNQELVFPKTGLKDMKYIEYYIITKPVLDKLVAVVFDALTGIIWHDDSQVARLTATKRYGECASCEIVIGEIK